MPTEPSAAPERADRILSAALELFARHGYPATSVRMIAEHAGVAQGLMYTYFADKRALLAAVLERGMEDVRASFRAPDPADPPGRQLEALIRASFELVGRHRDFWRLSYGVRMQPAVLEGMAGEVIAWTGEIRRQLQAHFRALNDPSPAAAAAVLFAAIDGVSQHYVMAPEAYPLEPVTAELVERFCRQRNQ